MACFLDATHIVDRPTQPTSSHVVLYVKPLSYFVQLYYLSIASVSA